MISDQIWAGIRTEFTLPTLAQVHRRRPPEDEPRSLLQALEGFRWR